MYRMALAGHLCIDLVPELNSDARMTPGELFEVGPLQVRLGGSVANTGRVLGTLGMTPDAYASVGDDDLGRFIVDRLRLLGVTPHIRVEPGQTTSYSVVIEPDGVDRAFWHHPGSNATFDGSSVDLTDVALVHLGYPSLLPSMMADDGAPLLHFLRRVKEADATSSVDLAVIAPEADMARLPWEHILTAMSSVTDVLSPSAADLASALHLSRPVSVPDARVLARDLVARGFAVVAISLGPDGLVLHTADAERLRRGGRALSCVADVWASADLHVPAVPGVGQGTTVGAGDAVSAGILYGILHGYTPLGAAELATACAAAILDGRPASLENVTRLRERLPDRTEPSAGLSPFDLGPNQPADRFYRGGARIARFRGLAPATQFTPEDWIGSVVTVRGEPTTGLTTLPDGRVLREAIAADPVGWLGESHVARWGSDPKLLVKLLDAGQRLPIHAHPGTVFAAEHLGAAHGKAEAWYILRPGTVYLGLRRDLTADELALLVAEQRTEQMLALMHEVQVAAGDRVYVPTGLLHAIGEGIVLAEVQEPEDLSILLEWQGFAIDGAAEGHLGLGFETALTAVDRRRRRAHEVDRLLVRAASTNQGLVAETVPYFRLDHVSVKPRAQIDAGFAVIIVIEGDARLDCEAGAMSVAAGRTLLVPHSSGRLTFTGDGVLLVARPPTP